MVKMSRVEFTRFFTRIFARILLVFLFKNCSYLARIFKKMSSYEEFGTLATLYNLFYSRPMSLTSKSLLQRFKFHVDAAKNIAKQRGSNALKKIEIPTLLNSSIRKYEVILSQFMVDHRELRHQNQNERRQLNIRRSQCTGLNNTPSNLKSFSSQKRQILLRDSLAKLSSVPRTALGNIELANAT